MALATVVFCCGSVTRSDTERMIQIVRDIVDGGTQTMGPRKAVILMHDHMFRSTRENRPKLVAFIKGLKALTGRYTVGFGKISDY